MTGITPHSFLFTETQMGIALWTGLRQLEALRSSTMIALMQGGAGNIINGNNFELFAKWAKEEGFDDPTLLDNIRPEGFNSRRKFAVLWHMAIDAKAENREDEARAEATRTTEDLDVDTDYGPDRSSAHWDRWSNFVTTSSFVRKHFNSDNSAKYRGHPRCKLGTMRKGKA